MTLNATAEALAGGEVAPSVDTTASPAPETPDLDTALDAIWNKAQAEGIENADTGGDEAEAKPEKAEEPAKEAEPKQEAAPEPEPAPTDLPAGVKAAWKDIPAEAREAIVASQREMSAKLAEQGRQVKTIAPIRDALANASKDLPFIREMSTEQVTRELMALARTAQGFRSDPVGTLMALVDAHGAREGIAKALGVEAGQQAGPDLVRYVKQLEAKVAEIADPSFIEQQFSRVSTTREMESAVKAFAADLPDWNEVEDFMPQAVQFVQQRNAKKGLNASPQDVLKAAYALAKGEPQLEQPKVATEPAAVEAAPTVDPERARAAKSVNVKSSGTGAARVKTEEELMEAVWKRAHS